MCGYLTAWDEASWQGLSLRGGVNVHRYSSSPSLSECVECCCNVCLWLGVIIFGLIWFLSKKLTKLNFFLKKNQNRFKPTDFGSFRFSFLGQKPVQLGFSWFGSVFSVFCRFWLGFFSSVRFSFFSFRLIKPKPKPNRPVFSKF